MESDSDSLGIQISILAESFQFYMESDSNSLGIQISILAGVLSVLHGV